MPQRIVTKILSVQHAMDIVMYLYDRGETKQRDMQCKFTSNNDVLARRLALLMENGIICVEIRRCTDSKHHAKYWKLTEKGNGIAKLINQMENVFKGVEHLE